MCGGAATGRMPREGRKWEGGWARAARRRGGGAGSRSTLTPPSNYKMAQFRRGMLPGACPDVAGLYAAILRARFQICGGYGFAIVEYYAGKCHNRIQQVSMGKDINTYEDCIHY